ERSCCVASIRIDVVVPNDCLSARIPADIEVTNRESVDVIAGCRGISIGDHPGDIVVLNKSAQLAARVVQRYATAEVMDVVSLEVGNAPECGGECDSLLRKQ